MTNRVMMTPGVTRGEEVIRYPDDVIYLRGVDHGNVQVIEYFSTDRPGPPKHAHQWDEIEIVIDGVVEFEVGEEIVTGGPGTVQFLPAGVPHAVRVPEGEARLVYVTIGPPYDSFAREVARLADEGALDQLPVRAAEYGVTLVCRALPRPTSAAGLPEHDWFVVSHEQNHSLSDAPSTTGWQQPGAHEAGSGTEGAVVPRRTLLRGRP